MTKLYLISPPDFVLEDLNAKLRNILRNFTIPIFQLRVKNKTKEQVKIYAEKLLKTCNEFNCLFILNDYVDIAIEIGANGVHVGSKDQNIAKIRGEVGEDFIIGASCYDSRDLTLEAVTQGASYISFGTFFPSVTKNSQGRPDISMVDWAREKFDLPIVTIGGISDKNCRSLVEAKADFIAVVSYVWNNPDGEISAIENLMKSIGSLKDEAPKIVFN